MISLIYFIIFIISLLTFAYDQPSFQSRLPDVLWRQVDPSTKELSPTLIKHKSKIYISFSVLTLIQILSHIRIPQSKGDLLAMIFELVTYGLLFTFTLYLLHEPFNNSLNNSSSAASNNIKKWVNAAYLWTEFRVHDVLFWSAILYIANITLSLL